eukprot:NODE_13260_length_1176_cov_3.093422.p2 GENE.NODE_13260_length_1176_cov_3.093422~~NODE_13260_length_1176_cov_3.093422.p2  ORF type:complete len:134 (-),score=38.24 NODE_13260_length_1176_cov_3.093422:311-712(-)
MRKPLIFLHVFHHAITPSLCVLPYLSPLPFMTFTIMVNASVHAVMYYYYFLSACGKHVWWKQYVTVFQIVQFCAGVVFTLLDIWYHATMPGGCQDPEAVAIIATSWVVFLGLFAGFYFTTYKGKAPKRKRNVE